MISFDLTEEQRMIRDTVVAFAAAEIRPAARPADETGAIPPPLIEQAWELGLVRGALPERFGGYGDALFRWNRTTANDQYLASIGLFQQIKGWEIQAGYRRLGTVSGDDIIYDPATPSTINYPVAVRENSDSIEAGFNYTTSKRHWQFGFYSRTVVDGGNSDGKFWFGGYVNVPFTIFKPKL